MSCGRINGHDSNTSSSSSLRTGARFHKSAVSPFISSGRIPEKRKLNKSRSRMRSKSQTQKQTNQTPHPPHRVLPEWPGSTSGLSSKACLTSAAVPEEKLKQFKVQQHGEVAGDCWCVCKTQQRSDAHTKAMLRKTSHHW